MIAGMSLSGHQQTERSRLDSLFSSLKSTGGVEEIVGKSGGGKSGGGGLLGSIGSAGEALSGMGGGLAEVGSALTAVSEAAGPVGIALAAVVVGFNQVTEAGGKVLNFITGFVQNASPATVQRFTLVWEDLRAVIGQRLTPILQFLTNALRFAADTLDAVLPPATAISAIMKDYQSVLESSKDSIRAVAAIIRTDLVVQLQLLAVTMKMTASAIKAVNALGNIISAGMMGRLSYALGDSSSVGAAARQAQFTSVEDVSRHAATAAYMTGGRNVPEKQLSTLEQIRDFMYKVWKGGPDHAEQARQAVQ